MSNKGVYVKIMFGRACFILMLNILQGESLGGLASLTNLRVEVNSVSGGDRCQVTMWYLLRISTGCVKLIQDESLKS